MRPADWKRALPGLLVSLVCLAIVLYLADPRQLAQALRRADYRLVAAAYASSLVWILVRAVAWRTLLQEKASLSQTFLTINEGYLINNLLPFRLGEVARGFLLSRKAGLSFWQVISTIVIERLLDLAFAAALLLSSLPFVIGASWAKNTAWIAAGLVLLGLGGLYLLARNHLWAEQKFNQLAARWPWLGRLGSQQAPAFLSGLAILTDWRRFLRAVLWFTLNWGLAVGQYYLFLLAYFQDAQPLWAAFALGFIALGMAAPSSPGAVGVMELAAVAALSLFKLDPAQTLAMALTMHLSNYLITGLLGAYALAQEGETLSGLFRQARQISTKEPEPK